MSYLIDTHCHLHDLQFFSEEQAEAMIKRAHEKGIEKIICIGTDPEDSLAAAEFANKHDGVYWTYGIHPEETTNKLRPESLVAGANSYTTAFRNIPNRSSLVAIGEVGLDYHSDGFDRKKQIQLFEEILQLAVDNDLPVSFHVRNAFPDFFAVTANFPTIRGCVHSFTDSKKVLKKILETTDFYVGVNGLATYSTLPTPPLERILLETDAPFLAPTPFRGKINEPAYIFEIAEWLSKKLAVDFETVKKQTTENAKKLFNLK